MFAAALLFIACRAAIFDMISREVAPIEPLIMGSPTNMVVGNFQGIDYMFVASGHTLHWYRDGQWGISLPIERPGGRISMLAATDQFLFALVNNDSIRRLNLTTGEWETIAIPAALSRGLLVQSIYAPNPASNHVFIGLGTGIASPADILYIRDTTTDVHLLESDTGMLTGAAFDGTNYFLAIRASINASNAVVNYGNSILRFSGSSLQATLTVSTDHAGAGFTGIIDTGSGVMAINRDGNLFNVTAGSITRIRDEMMHPGFSTGAIAVWEDPQNAANRRLLAGRQGSLSYSFATTGFTYGYMEFIFDSSSGFYEPGSSAASPGSSVTDHSLYISTIGRHVVNHIFQAPTSVCSERRLFASTQRSGLWSYRNRDGIWQWNAEN